MTRTGLNPVPVITVYRHGGKAGVAPMKNGHARATRGDVGGWSLGATRRNTEFLYSIREDQLDGVGFAVTLTLRECPPDAAAWHRLRRAWEMRVSRAGMVRLHWVTEWQRRGVPHLHGAIWFPAETAAESAHAMVAHWCKVGEAYGAGFRGQHVRRIDGAVGWFQYLSKHAARGVKHYQRSSENVPEAWQTKTGRMWGKSGSWPVQPASRFNLKARDGDGAWFAYRRLFRSWRVADARASGERNRLRLARRMLACNEQRLSEVRGVSEWIPGGIQLAMLANLLTRGYAVVYDDRAADVQGSCTSEADNDAEWLNEAMGCGA